MTSELIRMETLAVLRRKFVVHQQAVTIFELLWAEAAYIADIDSPREDADARLVAAATAAGVDLFVTGDQRVLGWNPVDSAQSENSMLIMSPREAWARLFTDNPQQPAK